MEPPASSKPIRCGQVDTPALTTQWSFSIPEFSHLTQCLLTAKVVLASLPKPATRRTTALESSRCARAVHCHQPQLAQVRTVTTQSLAVATAHTLPASLPAESGTRARSPSRVSHPTQTSFRCRCSPSSLRQAAHALPTRRPACCRTPQIN